MDPILPCEPYNTPYNVSEQTVRRTARPGPASLIILAEYIYQYTQFLLFFQCNIRLFFSFNSPEPFPGKIKFMEHKAVSKLFQAMRNPNIGGKSCKISFAIKNELIVYYQSVLIDIISGADQDFATGGGALC